MKTLPKQYAVKTKNSLQVNEVMKLVYDQDNYIINNYNYVRIHQYGFNGCHLFHSSSDLYPEFSFTEWKALFTNKNIIGYKLIKPEYEKMLDSLTGMWWSGYANKCMNNSNYHFAFCDKKGSINDLLKKAGVLDLWFEPVYEEQKPTLPKIGNYDGAYDKQRGIIKYGCVQVSKETIYKLRDVLKELEGCHFEHKTTHITKEQVEQIITYIEKQ